MMNNATVLNWLLLLCVAALPSALLSSVLVDTDGDILRNGGVYEILTYGGDEGIAPRPGFLGNCPVGVFQYPRGLSEPVRISSPARIAILHSGLPLNISFTKLPESAAPCTNSTEWQLEKISEGIEYVLVGFEAAVQFPGTVLNGFFRIIQSSEEQPAGYYNILFCERESSHCRAIGGRLDAYQRAFRLVAVDEDPLAVKFVKVPETAAAAGEKEEHLKMVV